MSNNGSESIIEELKNFIVDETYPCVAARAAIARDHIPCFIADHMGCPKDDSAILEFINGFTKDYRNAQSTFHSAAIIFRQPTQLTAEIFETLLWQRLQSLSQIDATKFLYDKRVSSNPSSPDFSFSLGEEAFFVIGLHPASERRSRKFKHPTLVFNPHAQFEQMRREDRYEKMKQIVRKRDILYSGSINPMLADFGTASEVYQYSGHRHNEEWNCPLRINHANNKDNPTEE